MNALPSLQYKDFREGLCKKQTAKAARKQHVSETEKRKGPRQIKLISKRGGQPCSAMPSGSQPWNSVSCTFLLQPSDFLKQMMAHISAVPALQDLAEMILRCCS